MTDNRWPIDRLLVRIALSVALVGSLALWNSSQSASATSPARKPFAASAPLGGSHMVTVTATVPPTHLVVVDGNHRIVRIVSNTDRHARPIFVEGSERGEVLRECSECLERYRAIFDPELFLREGTVYER